MEKKITEHDEKFKVVDEELEKHREQILQLQHAQEKFQSEVTDLKKDLVGVQKGQAQLELTVMKDGKETRDLLRPFADHVLKQAEFEAQTEKDIKIKKMDTREKILTGIFGAGGLAGIVAAIITLFN
ncbi:hypothetical protein [Bacillus weihaiensis]|uniref:hypothetical protein n=1 Tax=Bacillus weihaiensis TaxID=1547283 RepID=UPI0023544FF0|nr:hypothetical protein [Bacillus weihaiensis]